MSQKQNSETVCARVHRATARKIRSAAALQGLSFAKMLDQIFEEWEASRKRGKN